MFYIYRQACISPLIPTSEFKSITSTHAVDGKLKIHEQPIEEIPGSVLRRMGKAVRMGIGAALPVLKDQPKPDGIVIGTANCGKEDSIRFLEQLTAFDEGMLTPMNFVQSTPNAVAAQIGLFTKNHGYNISHVHHGLSFENALLDVDMLLEINNNKKYLLGGIDDISDSNYHSEYKAGWYKDSIAIPDDFYSSKTNGSVPGEAAAMFLCGTNKEGAIARFTGVSMIHTNQLSDVIYRCNLFLQKELPENERIDLFLSGENGDIRLQAFYDSVTELFSEKAQVARFKHCCGEFATASAFGLWVAINCLQEQYIPNSFLKRGDNKTSIRNILIYNNYRNRQHGFILLSAVD